MRFLRLTLSTAVVPLDPSIERGEILNNRYLADGSVIELSRFEGDRDAIVSAMADNPGTIDFELLESDAEQHYVFHHFRPDGDATIHQLISLLDEFRLVITYPVRVDPARGVTIDLVGSTELVQEAYRRLPAAVQRETEIEHVGEDVPLGGGLRSRLTARQREILDAAVDVGYYTVPREGTAEDVADAVGCAPSTASEHLRKIEARVLSVLAE